MSPAINTADSAPEFTPTYPSPRPSPSSSSSSILASRKQIPLPAALQIPINSSSLSTSAASTSLSSPTTTTTDMVNEREPSLAVTDQQQQQQNNTSHQKPLSHRNLDHLNAETSFNSNNNNRPRRRRLSSSASSTASGVSSVSSNGSSSAASSTIVFKRPTAHPSSWETLTDLVAKENLGPMGRSVQVQTAYQKAIERRTAKYGSMDNYILKRVLHWNIAPKDAGSNTLNSSSGAATPTSRSALMSPISSSSSTDENNNNDEVPQSPLAPVNPMNMKLIKNEFPYSVEQGIEHWLLWSRYPLEDRDWIQQYLEERLPGRQFLFFVNPTQLRSIKTIFHVQIFTKGDGPVISERELEVRLQQQGREQTLQLQQS